MKLNKLKFLYILKYHIPIKKELSIIKLKIHFNLKDKYMERVIQEIL